MMGKIFAAVAACLLIVVVGMIWHQEANTARITVDVQLRQGEDPFAIRSILPPDSTILRMQEIDRATNTYKMTVVTKRQNTFLDYLRNSSRVERISNVIN